MKEERKNIMEKLLCPSMMCANYRNLEKEVNDLIEAGVDIFHIDIMDGTVCSKLWNGITGCGVYLQSINNTC